MYRHVSDVCVFVCVCVCLKGLLNFKEVPRTKINMPMWPFQVIYIYICVYILSQYDYTELLAIYYFAVFYFIIF